MSDLPPDFLDYLQSITAKRARTVIDHILEHGYITTEELKDEYGYNHPPRAARDVREYGIPLETFKIRGKDGRIIAAYRFGDPKELRRLGGRRNFPKDFKKQLVEHYGARDAITLETLDAKDLQIDHRIPYSVVGESENLAVEDFMLLSASTNRAKSWSCENCENSNHISDTDICRQCYWAYPNDYQHIAMRAVYRLDIVWSEDERASYMALKADAQRQKMDVQTYVKQLILAHLNDKSSDDSDLG